jgi:hypothetical protein
VKNFLFIAGALALALFVATATAQQNPRSGAKTEKTYGLGIPRDLDKLAPQDSEYPVFPLLPGQEAYRDVDGYRIKELLKEFTAISLQSQKDGEQFWGRIPGTKYDHRTAGPEIRCARTGCKAPAIHRARHLVPHQVGDIL